MLNDAYVKLQTVVENIVSLTTYESAEEIEKAVKSARYKEDQWIGGIFDAIVSLREIPAADVEPKRKTGHWIDVYVTNPARTRTMCSECGLFSGIGGIPSNRYKPYCPNCGSPMLPEPPKSWTDNPWCNAVDKVLESEPPKEEDDAEVH